MRLREKKKFKIFDDLNSVGDIDKLIKKGNPQTKSFYVDKKPVFENKDYKIYDELKYLDTAELYEYKSINAQYRVACFGYCREELRMDVR